MKFCFNCELHRKCQIYLVGIKELAKQWKLELPRGRFRKQLPTFCGTRNLHGTSICNKIVNQTKCQIYNSWELLMSLLHAAKLT